jgi:hypothetical protein
MTVISTILKRDHIAFASDSLITMSMSGKFEVVEEQEAKFILFPKLKCIAGYWGLARVYDSNKNLKWSIHDWLTRQVKEAEKFDTIRSFGLQLKKDLDNIFRIGAARHVESQGLGIHLAGFESFGNFRVPELYLLTNYGFKDGFYVKTRKALEFSARAYPTCKGATDLNTDDEKIQLVKSFFEDGKTMIFNNGDPILFNSLANGLGALHLHTRPHLRNEFKDEIAFLKFQSSYGIQLSKDYQQKFYRADQVRVGGMIHSKILTSDGLWL